MTENGNIVAMEDQVNWDEVVDVVVIGSGFAGLVAAREAAKTADSIVVLEKMSYFGGNSRIAGGGYCCWDSKLKLREKLDLGQDSWELHAADTLACGQGYNDPALVEAMAREAPLGVDLMVDAGIPFRDSLPRIGGHSAYRSYQIACTGAETMEKLRDFCLDVTKSQLRCGVTVVGLVREPGEAGRVMGVATRPTKEPDAPVRLIGARRGVIVASGGFAQDVALRCAHKPSLTADYSCTNHKGATGELIRLAQAIGADVVHMEFVQLYPCANPKTGGIDQAAFLAYSGTGYGAIYVDGRGERFVNELASREAVSAAQIATGAKPTWVLFNDEIFRSLGVGDDAVESMVRSGRLLRGEDARRLAAVAGFDAATLEASLRAHDKALSEGVDPQFGTPMTAQMATFGDGPLYAAAQWPSVHYCMGGLRINPQAQVLDAFGRPLPGLYAAGEVCGGLHGIDRLGGNGIAECFVFGRRAGQLHPAKDVAGAGG